MLLLAVVTERLAAERLACRSTAALPLIHRPPAIIPHCQGVERAGGLMDEAVEGGEELNERTSSGGLIF
mgnify:CR=1 FL=1